MDEIKWEPSVTASEIGVSVSKGVVTLNGTVATYAEKWAVERAAQRVEGIRGIAEDISVKTSGIHVKSDTEIAEAAVVSLKTHVWVPTEIQPTVAQGWITLKGQVNCEYQRSAAADSVRFLSGVKGVTNEITLKPSARPSAVKDAIEKALVRNAKIDAGTVTVATDAGKVTAIDLSSPAPAKKVDGDGKAVKLPGNGSRLRVPFSSCPPLLCSDSNEIEVI